MREVTCRMLASNGCQAITAVDGPIVIEIVTSHPVDRRTDHRGVMPQMRRKAAERHCIFPRP